MNSSYNPDQSTSVEQKTTAEREIRKRRIFTTKEKAEIYKSYIENDTSYGKLGLKLNCPRTTIQTIVENGPYEEERGQNRVHKMPEILYQHEAHLLELMDTIRGNKMPLTLDVRNLYTYGADLLFTDITLGDFNFDPNIKIKPSKA